MFMPESAYGPTNQCIGLGKVLLDRGHRVVFAAETSWAGRLEPFGFVEALVDLAEPEPDAGESGEGAAGQFWIDFVNETAPEFAKPTRDQLASFVQPTYDALVTGARYAEPRLREIIAEHRPDVIVEDNVVSFPALPACGRPWVRITSCNPAELKDPDVPPVFSGYPVADRSGWAEYWDEYRRAHAQLHESFSAFCVQRGAPPLPGLDFIHESPWLNLYLYPPAIDYARARPLGPTWHNLGASVRATDAAWEAERGDGKLLYLSLGSLGSGDVELMQRLIDTLAQSPHRVIVSKGPQHDRIRLADNMTGAEFLPQTSLLPQVDLVITHGGNNTVTEALYFGKPMVVLPLFWDQYDNAQRIDEMGLGARLDTYGHEPAELLGAVDRLLADSALAERLRVLSGELQAAPGTVRAADLIEGVAAQAGM
jgi:MGT family glycosyltransferase